MQGKPRLLPAIGAALLVLLLLPLTTRSARAAQYSDVEGHWAAPAIQRWSESGILKGYSDGRFGPDDPVTRCQLSEILYRVWGCEPKIGHSYVDLSQNDWYYEGLSTMNAYGVALGQGERIYPEEQLTREEAFYMVAKAFDLGGDSPHRSDIPRIGDADEIEASFTYRLSALFGRKALNGAPDGNFHPKDLVTRAEVMTVIDNLFDVCLDAPGEYTLAQDQVALVTCPEVTVTYTPVKYAVGVDVYVMAGTGPSGVTFHASEDVGVVDIYGVSSGENAFHGDEGLYLRYNIWDLTDPQQVPDLSFAGGCGVKRDPYRIATGEQFLRIVEQPSVREGRGTNFFYELVDNVTLPELKGSLYLGSQTPYLDGKGHTVTYYMKGEIDGIWGDFGLFGRAGGEFSNLTLDGTVDAVLKVTSEKQEGVAITFGGLAGKVTGNLVNCCSKLDITLRYDGEVPCALYVGGLAGTLREASMTGCVASGKIKAATLIPSSEIWVGGLAGNTSHAKYSLSQIKPGVIDAPLAEERQPVIQNCGSSAVLSVEGGEHTGCGGILGLQTLDPSDAAAVDDSAAYALMENCWSTATLSASGASFQSDCGGLVGQNFAGYIQNCWAQPTITISGTHIFKNQGGICGCIGAGGGEAATTIENCWANISNCPPLPWDGHYGGIVARAWDCTISNCFVLGTQGYARENAISYDSWTTGTVTDCADFTDTTQDQRKAFYDSCGWDFETVWDNTGSYPILRGCDPAAQREAQQAVRPWSGGTGERVVV